MQWLCSGFGGAWVVCDCDTCIWLLYFVLYVSKGYNIKYVLDGSARLTLVLDFPTVCHGGAGCLFVYRCVHLSNTICAPLWCGCKRCPLIAFGFGGCHKFIEQKLLVHRF